METGGVQSDNSIKDFSNLNLKQKFAYAMRCITGDKSEFWLGKIDKWKGSESTLEKRGAKLVLSSPKERERVVRKGFNDLVTVKKYGELDTETRSKLNNTASKLEKGNIFQRRQAYKEFRKIEKEAIANSENKKPLTLTKDQINSFRVNFFTGISSRLSIPGLEGKFYKKSEPPDADFNELKGTTWGFKPGRPPFLSVSKEVETGGVLKTEEVHLQDIKFKSETDENGNKEIIASFKDPINTNWFLEVKVQDSVFADDLAKLKTQILNAGEGGCYIGKDGAVKPSSAEPNNTEISQPDAPASEGNNVQNLGDDQNTPEVQAAQDVTLGGQVDESIIRQCKDLVVNEAFGLAAEHGGSIELMNDFKFVLDSRLANMQKSGTLTVESFKSAVAEEKEKFLKGNNLTEKTSVKEASATSQSGTITKAEVSKAKTILKAMASGAKKFGKGTMIGLRAIGNAFVNAGRFFKHKVLHAELNSINSLGEGEIADESLTLTLNREQSSQLASAVLSSFLGAVRNSSKDSESMKYIKDSGWDSTIGDCLDDPNGNYFISIKKGDNSKEVHLEDVRFEAMPNESGKIEIFASFEDPFFEGPSSTKSEDSLDTTSNAPVIKFRISDEAFKDDLAKLKEQILGAKGKECNVNIIGEDGAVKPSSTEPNNTEISQPDAPASEGNNVQNLGDDQNTPEVQKMQIDQDVVPESKVDKEAANQCSKMIGKEVQKICDEYIIESGQVDSFRYALRLQLTSMQESGTLSVESFKSAVAGEKEKFLRGNNLTKKTSVTSQKAMGGASSGVTKKRSNKLNSDGRYANQLDNESKAHDDVSIQNEIDDDDYQIWGGEENQDELEDKLDIANANNPFEKDFEEGF